MEEHQQKCSWRGRKYMYAPWSNVCCGAKIVRDAHGEVDKRAEGVEKVEWYVLCISEESLRVIRNKTADHQ